MTASTDALDLESLLRDLDAEGRMGLDLSPGDPLARRAAAAIRTLLAAEEFGRLTTAGLDLLEIEARHVIYDDDENTTAASFFDPDGFKAHCDRGKLIAILHTLEPLLAQLRESARAIRIADEAGEIKRSETGPERIYAVELLKILRCFAEVEAARMEKLDSKTA